MLYALSLQRIKIKWNSLAMRELTEKNWLEIKIFLLALQSIAEKK
jgi:hypothetical protein